MTGRAWRVVAGVLAIVGAVTLLAWITFVRAVYEPPPPLPAAPAVLPEPAAPAGPARLDVAVVAVLGEVERSRPEGGWKQVLAGDRLATDDALRTGAGGRADLSVGASSRVSVAERSQIAVREVTAAVHRLKLSRGRIAVDHAGDGSRVLVVEDESGGRVAEARQGRFSVLASGTTLAVAAETGSVTLRAAGAAVEVRAGQQSVAAAGVPSPAAPIPVDVLLKVADAARVGGDLCAVVQGRAAAGSEVTVDRSPVPLDAEGRFAVRVRRRPGLAAVRVETRDPSGRIAAREVPCRESDEDEDERISRLRVRWKE